MFFYFTDLGRRRFESEYYSIFLCHMIRKLVRNEMVNPVSDPCSLQQSGPLNQTDVYCGGSVNLHCQGGCIRSEDISILYKQWLTLDFIFNILSFVLSICKVSMKKLDATKVNRLILYENTLFQHPQSFICMQNAQIFRHSAGRDGEEVVH